MADFPETGKGLMPLCIEFAQFPHEFQKAWTIARVRPYMLYDSQRTDLPRTILAGQIS